MNQAVRDLHNRRVQERDPRVMVFSRPSRCLLPTATERKEAAPEAMPQRRTAFSFVNVLLSKMGV